MAIVLHSGGDGEGHRAIHVGAAGDDEWIRTAKFEHAFLQVLPREFGDAPSGTLRTGDGHTVHSLVGDDRGDLIDLDEQVREHAFGHTGSLEEVLEVQSAAGHVGRVLEEHDITRHQIGRRETYNLPKGKIPRHDRQQGPRWLVAHPTSRGIGRDVLGL